MFGKTKASFLDHCQSMYTEKLVTDGILTPLEDINLAELSIDETLDENVSGLKESLSSFGAFHKKHPRAIKAGAVLFSSLVLVSSCGCSLGTVTYKGKIVDVEQKAGLDGVMDTADDYIFLKVSKSKGDGTYGSNTRFSIENNSGNNLPYLMEQLEKDGYVKLEYDKDSESPQLVERILGIRSAEEQEEKEAEYEKESQESRTFCFYGCLSVAGVALIPVIYFGGKSYLVNRAKIKNKKE